MAPSTGNSKPRRDKKSSSKDKEKKSSKGTGKENSKSQPRTLTEFEYGELFTRYADGENATGLTRDQFSKLMEDLKLRGPLPTKESEASAGSSTTLTPRTKFDAGVQFAKYDKQGNGLIDKESFQQILRDVVGSRGEVHSETHAVATPLRNTTLPPYVTSGRASQSHWISVRDQTGQDFTPSARNLGTGSLPPYYAHDLRTSSNLMTVQAMSSSEVTESNSENKNPHTLSIRKDYLGLRTQIESVLISRKDVENSLLDEICHKQEHIVEEAQVIATDTIKYFNNVIDRLKQETASKLKRLNHTKEAHMLALDRIYQFERATFGRNPSQGLEDVASFPRKPNLGYYSHTATGGTEVQSPGTILEDIRKFLSESCGDAAVQPALPAVEGLSTTSMVEFVRNFPELRERAERLAGSVANNGEVMRQQERTRALVAQIESEPLVNEIQKLQDAAGKHKGLDEALTEKDKLLWMLVEEKEELERERAEFEREKEETFTQVDALTRASTEEVAKWAQLADNLTEDFSTQIAQLQEENRILQEAIKTFQQQQ